MSVNCGRAKVKWQARGITAAVWSTWEGERVAGGRAMGGFVHGPCGGDSWCCSHGTGRSAEARTELLFATHCTGSVRYNKLSQFLLELA